MSASLKKQRQQIVTNFRTLIFVLLTILLAFFLVTYGAQYSSEQRVQKISISSTTPALLHDKPIVVLETKNSTPEETLPPIEKVLFEYVEVIDGCSARFEGECLLVRAGPGTDFPVVSKLRNGIVLKVGGKVSRDGSIWYKIIYDEWLRYPERVTSDWYVAADYVEIIYDEGDKITGKHPYATTTAKSITIDRSLQKLYAYENDELFMETSISTGLALTPTPRGTFTIYKKTPSRYMQGPLPNLPADQYYDLPGVPWNLYFTEGGAVIHGTYWHTNFGSPYSHGCVNLSPTDARTLYIWAELGTPVIVRD